MAQVRRLSEGESEEGDLIWLQAFERGNLDRLPSLRSFRDQFNYRIVRFGLWDSEGMQATFEMMNTQLNFGPAMLLPSTYISSIACKPASRGRGYGGAGLIHMLSDMRDSGKVLTTLCPANYDYYRQFGWEWINSRRLYRVPTAALESSPETQFVRAMRPNDKPAVEAVYATFASRYRGMSVRDEAEWDYLLGDRPSSVSYTYVYVREGAVEGYVVVREGSSEETFLPEFLALTSRAHRGLLGLLRTLQMQTKVFKWDAPEDDTLWSVCFHREIETSIRPVMQGRVVDVTRALSALQPTDGLVGECVISVQDPCVPWNQGRFQVCVYGGRAEVYASTKEADVEMDIQAFTQAYFGVLSVTQLRHRERITVASDAAFAILERLFAGPPMWNNGAF